ncbi:MAG: PIN domain-containing protein [Desulfurellaceae bacterium]|nr:PIN domain-containing protein [Desulfurellaceae bacterium]
MPLRMKHPRSEEVFIDTSAFYAVLDADDEVHAQARVGWTGLIRGGRLLVTSNYVCVETCALVQARLGMDAVRVLFDDMLPIVTVVMLDETLHTNAIATLLGANRRNLSLVDCTSFAVMHQRGTVRAFAFDQHFAEQGFQLVS